MKRKDLEFFLDSKGYSLGFREESPDRTFMAWILLSKRKPNERVLSMLGPGEEPEYVTKQELFRERPYQVLRLEYRRDDPTDIDDEIDDDELLREVHYFRTLDEVQEYVGDFGHALEDIKWRHDINPP